MMNLAPNIDIDISSMDLAFLPSEIIINILSRLPVKTVIHCKCVCKSWLELLETPEFAKNHLSRAVPSLIVYYDMFQIFEFADEVEFEHHNLLVEFEITMFTSTPPHGAMSIKGSANGLVLLCGYCPHATYVCNPITREYIELPCLNPYQNPSVLNGFGVTMMSGQYKVVRIFQKNEFDYETNKFIRTLKPECWVYTLGTRAWRISTVPCPFYYYFGLNAYLNGNLHWLVEDSNDGSYLISCFDLETEVFSTFSLPSLLGRPSFENYSAVFEDCLCICDESTESGYEIVIWVMKEYGNENSWTKQFGFSKDPDLAGQSLECYYLYPLKLFENGDILLVWGPWFLFYYSKKTNTAQKLDLFELRENIFFDAQLHVSSFLSLRSFAMETVSKF